jgi:hypothetical protein
MSEVEQSSERAPRAPIARKLSKPWIRVKLIREIALSGKTERQLAEEYDCAPSSINEFKKRHAERINAVREDASNEFAGIWIADKAKRIETYMAQVEYIEGKIADGTAGEDEAALLRLSQAGLKSVAEEMGQLTARVAVNADVAAKVNYEVVGVDTEALK